ncbi:MAG: hypothetical protein HZA81_01030 [Candidatus Taylorbacteria bacterium]|nr:hypothetical protein [Candidatus Taylorbacteria bacterium]
MFTKKSLWIQLSEDAAEIAVAVVASVLVIVFLSNKIGAASDAVVESRRLSQALKDRTAVVSELTEQYRRIKGKDALIESALIYSSNTLEFVTALESVAAKNNVSMAVRFETPSELGIEIGNPPHSLSEINFSLSLQGNVFTVLGFLKDVERLPYFTKIRSIALSSQTQEGWQNTSNVAVQGKIYTRSDN